MDLQSTFYVIGIIFMGLMLILFIVLVVAVLVIRAKINAIHRHLEDKLSGVLGLIEDGAKLASSVKNAVTKK
jgi:hypothetical protein